MCMAPYGEIILRINVLVAPLKRKKKENKKASSINCVIPPKSLKHSKTYMISAKNLKL